MGTGLAQDNQGTSGWESKRGECFSEEERRVVAGSCGGDASDVVQAIDNEGDWAVRCPAKRAGNHILERLLVGGKAWALVGDQVGIVFGEPTQEAPEHGFGAYAGRTSPSAWPR